ncbi:MAG: TonB-dependent receptor [Gammaproteobacteria bacterium]|nr:TonB-dependent receptor [Gammaproteobacteria bacterium]MDE0251500.1 TonB-dependent receptor [Gammaproteobacteria bacterium]MDE0401817.1 TonB-dependent receptor [Gammaproteobacteria bacterium]
MKFETTEKAPALRSPYGNLNLMNLRFITVLLALFVFAGTASPQTEDEDEVEDEEEMESLVVTGSRLSDDLGELAGQVIVLTTEDIRATGEVTLERVLRQLPENLNPTTERYGSSLNTVSNFTASSTVNLRGLGSESTLILVDGKRIGYNGLLGGVTDVSSIPLNQVERIEVVLDGASAIYGSDAVGGVVNIITRKSFEGVELMLNYDTPTEGGFNETRLSVSTSQMYQGMYFRGSYQRSIHTGLDASDRELTLFQQSAFPGPSLHIRHASGTFGGCFPVAWELNGDILVRNEFLALSAADQAAATGYCHAILPDGFNADSMLDEISDWSEPMWGAATQEGYTVLPDVTKDGFLFGVTYNASDSMSFEARVRGENRTVLNNRGYISFIGELFKWNNPYNPFKQDVAIRGQRRDLPQPYDETESSHIDFALDVQGSLTDNIHFELSVGQTTTDSETYRHNNLDRSSLRAGTASDGVTPRIEYISGLTPEECAAMGGTVSFGRCRVFREPAIPVDPFGNISQFVAEEPLKATSYNRQFRFEGLVRSELFEVPAGLFRVLVGVSTNTTELESSADFQVGSFQSPIGNIAQFHSKASRSNSAVYAEAVLPVVSEVNPTALGERLTMTFSLRNDTYQEADISYYDTSRDGGSHNPDNVPELASETTGGVGMVWNPIDFVQVKFNFQNAFVTPQLNQLLRETYTGPNAPFQQIWLIQPDGSLSIKNLTISEGGNPDLVSETADTQSLGVSVAPEMFPGTRLSVTHSRTAYNNRINYLRNFLIDPNNLPTGTVYNPDTDEYYQDRRWVNVSEVERAGLDYEFLWNRSTDLGDFHFKVRLSTISKYEYVIDPNDPQNDARVSVVGTSNGSTIVGVVSKRSANFNFGWATAGLDWFFDISTRSKTTLEYTNVNRVYTPPTIADLTVSYILPSGGFFRIPESLAGGRLVMNLTNLFDEYGSTKLTNAEGESLPQSSPDASPLYGRVFNLSLHLSI